ACRSSAHPSLATTDHHVDRDHEDQRESARAPVTHDGVGREGAEPLAAWTLSPILPRIGTGLGACGTTTAIAYDHCCSLPEWTAQKRKRLVARYPLLRLDSVVCQWRQASSPRDTRVRGSNKRCLFG